MAVQRPYYGAFKLSKICPSSWVSWSCYALGMTMTMALSPAALADLATGGVGAAVLVTAIIGFFVSASSIQRHMRLSLLSSSYGQPQNLTTSGVFGVSRNPIYVAFLMPLFSIGYYSVVAAITASAAYIALMTVFIIRNEEQILSKTFGAAYDAYAARTPRWLVY